MNQPQTPDNEVARLREQIEFWKAKAYEAEEQEGKLEDEVDRLLELLNRAIEIGRTLSFPHMYDCQRENCSLCNKFEELAALAPAPEELTK